MDFKNMGAKKVLVVTDSIVRGLDAMKQVEEGLSREGIEYTVYDGSRVEPKDSSYVLLFPDPACIVQMLIRMIIESRKQLPSPSHANPMHFLLSVADPSLIPPS